jgi:UDP-GlcNAc:undecaprenyl-phosphate GlcNAc-1-phosphate transferase
MRSFIAIFLIALTASAVGTVQFQRLAIKMGFVDEPGRRKAQQTPIPMLGGLAIIIAFLVAILLAYYFILGRVPRTVTGVMLACSIVAI